MSALATSSTTPRGQFIVLEGLDRCGKSTQVDRLVAKLQESGRPARLQKFPGLSVMPLPKAHMLM
jgi:thymidylate kinase